MWWFSNLTKVFSRQILRVDSKTTISSHHPISLKIGQKPARLREHHWRDIQRSHRADYSAHSFVWRVVDASQRAWPWWQLSRRCTPPPCRRRRRAWRAHHSDRQRQACGRTQCRPSSRWAAAAHRRSRSPRRPPEVRRVERVRVRGRRGAQYAEREGTCLNWK